MRVRTFHSAFAVLVVLGAIALLSGRDRGNPPPPQPSPRAEKVAVAPEPVVYTATAGRTAPPYELYARRMTRVVLVSTLPVGPVLNAVVPFEPSAEPAPAPQNPAPVSSSRQGP